MTKIVIPLDRGGLIVWLLDKRLAARTAKEDARARQDEERVAYHDGRLDAYGDVLARLRATPKEVP